MLRNINTINLVSAISSLPLGWDFTVCIGDYDRFHSSNSLQKFACANGTACPGFNIIT